MGCTHLQRLGLVCLARRFNRDQRMPEARAFRRAGRGKSASPVRRGEGRGTLLE